MPECEGRHKDVKRIAKYAKTRQWLCETCVADLEKPSVKIPSPSSAGHEIEEGELLAVLFNDNGTCEIVAPASGGGSHLVAVRRRR